MTHHAKGNVSKMAHQLLPGGSSHVTSDIISHLTGFSGGKQLYSHLAKTKPYEREKGMFPNRWGRQMRDLYLNANVGAVKSL